MILHSRTFWCTDVSCYTWIDTDVKHDVLFVDYYKHWTICYDIFPLYETDTHELFVQTASNMVKSVFSLPILEKFIFITLV